MLQQVQQNTIQRTLQHCILRLLSKIAGRWGLLLDTLDVTCLSYSSHDTAISVIMRHDTHGVSIRVKHATLARPLHATQYLSAWRPCFSGLRFDFTQTEQHAALSSFSDCKPRSPVLLLSQLQPLHREAFLHAFALGVLVFNYRCFPNTLP